MSESKGDGIRSGKSFGELWWQIHVEESLAYSIAEVEREGGRPLDEYETRVRRFRLKTILESQKPLIMKTYHARLLCDVIDELIVAANLEVDETGAEHLRIEGADLVRLRAAADALKAACE